MRRFANFYWMPAWHHKFYVKTLPTYISLAAKYW